MWTNCGSGGGARTQGRRGGWGKPTGTAAGGGRRGWRDAGRSGARKGFFGLDSTMPCAYARGILRSRARFIRTGGDGCLLPFPAAVRSRTDGRGAPVQRRVV
ncbi:hypothetical protein ABZP36_008015 [Zizania latifolia]